ncbi:hypothetical protein A2U01_0063567, partial [Trifolium medium]|nr:hypothetical protein [Trifolium medium]
NPASKKSGTEILNGGVIEEKWDMDPRCSEVSNR